MALLETLNAIDTNIETILETTLGYSLEDLSVEDIGTATLAQLMPGTMIIQDEDETSIEYADRDYLIQTKSEAKEPNDARAKANEITAALRGALTITALNSGDLAISRLVVSITGFTFPDYSHDGKTLHQACHFSINFNAE
ncbi:hypothetical protein KAR91_77575 [Candidatus Pacearchaeota archaeon]|nr:hypothetical protein [Candidatus Pacearchaeota archaeon]